MRTHRRRSRRAGFPRHIGGIGNESTLGLPHAYGRYKWSSSCLFTHAKLDSGRHLLWHWRFDMRSVRARNVQDGRRIRTLSNVWCRLRSWQASERMQLNFRVRTAPLPREATVHRDPPMAARRQEAHARLDSFARVELRISSCALLRQEGIAQLGPCQQEAQCARWGSGAQEAQTTSHRVREVRMLLQRSHHLQLRAPTALLGPSRQRGFQAATSAHLDQSRPHWARPRATSARPASMQPPRVLLSAQFAPRERPAQPAASRKTTATWTATTLRKLF